MIDQLLWVINQLTINKNRDAMCVLNGAGGVGCRDLSELFRFS
jgi:hypothetical protein